MNTATLSPAEISRYARQITLDGWGRAAQERVKSSRALIAGVGGPGSAAALYLLAAGLGYARLVDEGRIALADLSHQILFRERDLGKARAAVAQRRLQEINSFGQVDGHVKSLTEHNLTRLTADCHILVDASNSSRDGILLNRAATKLGIPLVHARIWGITGQLATFWPGRGPCLACASLAAMEPSQPAFLGPLAGVIGTLQALEALRLLAGLEPALLGRLLIFKANRFYCDERPLKANSRCLVCGSLP